MSSTWYCVNCNLASITCVCGTFEEPTVPDEGRGYPHRQKITCEAPTLPTAPCGETDYTTVFSPELQIFAVISKLYDENCDLITDQDGEPITLVIL